MANENYNYYDPSKFETIIEDNNNNSNILNIILKIKKDNLKRAYIFYCDKSMKKVIKELQKNGYKFTISANPNSKDYKDIEREYLCLVNKKENGLKMIYFHYLVAFHNLYHIRADKDYITRDISIAYDEIKKITKNGIVIDHIQPIDIETEWETRVFLQNNYKLTPVNGNMRISRNNNCYNNLCFLPNEVNSGIKAIYVDSINKIEGKGNKNKNITISRRNRGEYNINIFLDKPISLKTEEEISIDSICIINKLNRDNIEDIYTEFLGLLAEDRKKEVRNKIIETKKKESTEIRRILEELQNSKILNIVDNYISIEEPINTIALNKYLKGKHILVGKKINTPYYNSRVPVDSWKKEDIKEIEKY